MKKISITLEECELQKLKEWFHSSSDDEAVRSAVSHVLNQKIYSDLLELEGKVSWDGNLDDMRAERQ